MKWILVVGIALGLVLIVPVLAIWSLNALFALGIPYTWKTVLAALVLCVLVYSSNQGRD